jgi:hypothetical protein
MGKWRERNSCPLLLHMSVIIAFVENIMEFLQKIKNIKIKIKNDPTVGYMSKENEVYM